MKKVRLLLSMILSFILITCVSASVNAAWYKDKQGKFYVYDTDDAYGNRYIGLNWINNSLYLFDEDGYLQTGMWYTDYYGDKYYFKSDGRAIRGKAATIGDVKYYFDSYGRVEKIEGQKKTSKSTVSNQSYNDVLISDENTLYADENDNTYPNNYYVAASDGNYYIDPNYLYYQSQSQTKPSTSKTKKSTPKTTTTSTQKATTRSSNSQNYVLNKNTHKFHYPYCGSVYDIKAKNRWDYYGDRDEIIGMGYVPCKKCCP